MTGWLAWAPCSDYALPLPWLSRSMDMALLSRLLRLSDDDWLSDGNRMCLLMRLLLPMPRTFLIFFMLLQNNHKLTERDYGLAKQNTSLDHHHDAFLLPGWCFWLVINQMSSRGVVRRREEWRHQLKAWIFGLRCGFTSWRNEWRDEKAKCQDLPIGVSADCSRRESCHLLAWMALGCSPMHVSRKLVKEKPSDWVNGLEM